jgi:small subunit ribosomal protein S16
MPVKIRLQRHGKKGKPYYWIVAADARSKRDGKYLEKLGHYNPNVNPADINIDVDGTVKWLDNGAQPTDTARAILSYKGVLLKKHLAEGVKKGALNEEQADKKFQAWLDEKQAKIDAKKDGLSQAESDARTKALEAEKAINEARTVAPVVEEEVAEEAADAVVAEETSEETAPAQASNEEE